MYLYRCIFVGGDIFERVSAHVYTLQFWSFHPRRRAIKQHTVPLFGSKGIHMTDGTVSELSTELFRNLRFQKTDRD